MRRLAQWSIGCLIGLAAVLTLVSVIGRIVGAALGLQAASKVTAAPLTFPAALAELDPLLGMRIAGGAIALFVMTVVILLVLRTVARRVAPRSDTEPAPVANPRGRKRPVASVLASVAAAIAAVYAFSDLFGRLEAWNIVVAVDQGRQPSQPTALEVVQTGWLEIGVSALVAFVASLVCLRILGAILARMREAGWLMASGLAWRVAIGGATAALAAVSAYVTSYGQTREAFGGHDGAWVVAQTLRDHWIAMVVAALLSFAGAMVISELAARLVTGIRSGTLTGWTRVQIVLSAATGLIVILTHPALARDTSTSVVDAAFAGLLAAIAAFFALVIVFRIYRWVRAGFTQGGTA